MTPQPTPERSRCFMCGVEVCQWYAPVCTACKMKAFNESESQTPPVDSREDTGTRGEDDRYPWKDEVMYLAGLLAGKGMNPTNPLRKALQESEPDPLADRVESHTFLPGISTFPSTPPSEQSRVRSSKQSEEPISSGALENSHNGVPPAQAVPTPSSVSDQVGTPPKADSSAEARRAKEEGVGECRVCSTHVHSSRCRREGCLLCSHGKCDECYCEICDKITTTPKGSGWEMEIDALNLDTEEEKPSYFIKAIMRSTLTSAVRAAEERKDGEIEDKINKVTGHALDYEEEWHKDCMTCEILAAVLPPPPDKPTQP